jgi:hypothetical protein
MSGTCHPKHLIRKATSCQEIPLNPLSDLAYSPTGLYASHTWRHSFTAWSFGRSYSQRNLSNNWIHSANKFLSYLPLYYEAVKGYTPIISGVAVLPETGFVARGLNPSSDNGIY